MTIYFAEKSRLCVVTKFCWCLNLKIGAIVVGAVHLLGPLGYVAFGIGWNSITLTVLSIVSGLCLLVGAINKNGFAILFYFFFSIVQIVFSVSVGIYMSICKTTVPAMKENGLPKTPPIVEHEAD